MEEAMIINSNPSVHQFHVILTPQIKDFAGSTKKSGIGTWVIDCEHTEDFMPLVWQKATPHIVRGITMTDNEGAITCSWMEGTPTIDNIHMFVEIYDDAGKRAIAWDRIDGAKLQSIGNRGYRVIVYRYSKNIANKGNFELAKRTLINNISTDRSGAGTLSEEDILLERLVQLHSQQLSGSSQMSWNIWANYILSKPSAIREDLIQTGPPICIAHMFHPVHTPAEVELSNLNQVNKIGLDMIQRLKRESKKIRKGLDLLDYALSIYENQFKIRSQSNDIPTEGTESAEMLAQISNAMDIDHAEQASVTGELDL